jgi:hypothetical protein
MNEQLTQRKGMSKGCLVALIVVGVLLLLIIIAAIVCYVQKDELMKYGATEIVREVKKFAAENPQPGVDTTEVNAVADSLIGRLQTEQKVDLQKLGPFVQDVQHIRDDGKLDSTEARMFIQSAVNMYPDLAGKLPLEGKVPPDTTAVMDTLSIE